MSEKLPVAERIQNLEQQLEDARWEQAGRPADVNGVLEDVNGNRPVLAKDADIYFERERSKHEQETMPNAYEEMSPTQVAKALARAEYDGDKTKAEDLSDILVEKMAAMEDTGASKRDAEHNGDRSENIWDRVMGVKDKELTRLKEGKEGEKEQSANVDEARENVDAVLNSEASNDKATDANGSSTADEAEQQSNVDAAQEEKAKLSRVFESVEKGQVVRFRNKDGKLEEWEVKHVGGLDKHGNGGVYLEKTDGSGDGMSRLYQQLLDSIEEGPVEARKDNDISQNGHQNSGNDNSGLRPVREGEFDEGKENPPAGVQAIEPWTFDDYGKKDEGGPNKVPGPLVFEPPVDEPPVQEPPVEEPPVVDEPPVDPPTIEQPPIVVPPRIPENGGRRPERKRGWRKVAAVTAGALALIGVFGPEDGAHNTWSWKIPGINKTIHWSGAADLDLSEPSKGWRTNHRGNVPEVRTVDESDNTFGKAGASDQARTNIVDHYASAERFFDNIATKEGRADFKAMEKAIDAKAQEYMVKHGKAITEKRARELAEKDVKARLAALELHEAEAQVKTN